MDSNPIPMFSHFIAMKKQNPNQYWLPVTAAQMARSYQHHGPANLLAYLTTPYTSLTIANLIVFCGFKGGTGAHETKLYTANLHLCRI